MRCKSCRINKISLWTMRILCEIADTHADSTFLTLTYTDENLPYTSRGSQNSIAHSTLNPRDLTLFHKRLRKKGFTYKYYECGEYGENTSRPHYHIICVGIKSCAENAKVIQDTWALGNIHIGSVTHASIRYVTSYIMDKKAPEYYGEKLPPFQHSSQNFGEQALLKDIDQHIKNGFIMLQSGTKVNIPKFIIDKYGLQNELPMAHAMADKVRHLHGRSEKQKYKQEYQDQYVENFNGKDQKLSHNRQKL
ncbi:MAG: hypothetical protein FWB95_04080 [Treponema sp.]|nr:hypothetical protein [Treponema sp.]